MNFQNSTSYSGNLTIELAFCRKSIRDTWILIKHVGKTKVTEMQFTDKTKRMCFWDKYVEIRAFSSRQEEHFCSPVTFIVLTSGIHMT